MQSFAYSFSAAEQKEKSTSSAWNFRNITAASLATSLLLYKIGLYRQFRPLYDAAYTQFHEIKHRYKNIITVLVAQKAFNNLAYLTKLNKLQKKEKLKYVKTKFFQTKLSNNAGWGSTLLMTIKRSIQIFLKEHKLGGAPNPDVIYRGELANDIGRLQKIKTMLSDYRYISFSYAFSIALHKDLTIPALSLLIEQLTFIDDMLTEYKHAVIKR